MLFKLNPEQKRELKSLYRKASKLCHPDVANGKSALKARATFIELKLAYERNDLERGDVITEPARWRPTTSFDVQLRPVRDLTAAAGRLGGGDLGQRVRVDGGDAVLHGGHGLGGHVGGLHAEDVGEEQGNRPVQC